MTTEEQGTNLNQGPFSGVNPEKFYSFHDACQRLGIGKNHATHIRSKHREKLHRWGQDICCFGRDLISIFIEESGKDHDGN
jgi:hypothetical protein